MRIKWYWARLSTYFSNLRTYLAHASAREYREGKEVVFFDLKKSFNRYTYNLVKVFILAGYDVRLLHRFSLLANLKEYGKLLFKEPIRFTLHLPTDKNLIFVTDQPNLIRNEYRLEVFVDYNCFSQGKMMGKELLQFSFSMHPLMYKSENYDKIRGLTATKRKTKIIFAGNYQAHLYEAGSKYIEGLFHKTPRHETISYLMKSLKSDEIQVLSYKSLVSSDHVTNKFTFLDTQVARVQNEDWLDFLACGDFFLAPSGVYMPFSHNIIEAMAVGSIPITEYPELFNPPLVHDVNCVAYHGKEGVVDAVRHGLEMPEKEVKKLKEGVKKYYAKYLSPDSLRMRLESTASTQLIMPYNVELHSTRLYNKTKSASVS